MNLKNKLFEQDGTWTGYYDIWKAIDTFRDIDVRDFPSPYKLLQIHWLMDRLEE